MKRNTEDSEAAFRRIVQLEAQARADKRSPQAQRRSQAEAPKNISLIRRIRKAIWRSLPPQIKRRIDMLHTKKPAAWRTKSKDLALDRQTADERRKLYFRNARVIVYTALFGAYDTIPEPMLLPDNIDYKILTDQSVPGDSLWQRADLSLLPDTLRGDPVLCNRWCKMHPHLLFPDYEYSIYIDANIRIYSDLTPLTAGLEEFPVAMFRHKNRDCVYDEIQACLTQKKDTEAALKAHESLLRTHGVPEQWGLLEASLIARRHRDPVCIALMEAWWQTFLQGSRRDQISLIDCLWQMGITPSQIGTLGDNLRRCDLFLQLPHA